MTVNANHIYRYLTPRGWTINAICAMLGNMETESTINPGIWQNLDEGNTSLGYGLVQWTPATKYLNWCAENNLDDEHLESALARIEYELENGLQWIETEDFPISFTEFKTSTKSVEYLAGAFLRNYERPADQIQPNRAEQARTWYNVFKNLEPMKPIKKKKGLPLWLIVAATQKR